MTWAELRDKLAELSADKLAEIVCVHIKDEKSFTFHELADLKVGDNGLYLVEDFDD